MLISKAQMVIIPVLIGPNV